MHEKPINYAVSDCDGSDGDESLAETAQQDSLDDEIEEDVITVNLATCRPTAAATTGTSQVVTAGSIASKTADNIKNVSPVINGPQSGDSDFCVHTRYAALNGAIT